MRVLRVFGRRRRGPGRSWWNLLVATLVLGACAEQPPPPSRSPTPVVAQQRSVPTAAERPPVAPLPAPAPALAESRSGSQSVAAACEARRGVDGLRRAAVLRTLDGGLGRWLRNVDVDPKLEHGRFRGWIIRTLPDSDACYADLDLHAGDVVTRINGRPVEHPEEASQIWDGLRTSTALVIDFVRAGQPRTLRFKIVEP